MKIVATVVNAREAAFAGRLGPDLIEVRIDLMDADPARELSSIRSLWKGPIILTNRSAAEGGRWRGDAREWRDCTGPLLSFADIVDVEQPFSAFAKEIRRPGKGDHRIPPHRYHAIARGTRGDCA